MLILLAIGLFVGELHTGAGALGAAAVVALVLGSLMLYGPPEPIASAPAIRVSPVLIAAMSAVVAAFFLLVVRATLRARRLAVQTGDPSPDWTRGLRHLGARAFRHRADSQRGVERRVRGRTIDAGERVKVVGAAGVDVARHADGRRSLTVMEPFI